MLRGETVAENESIKRSTVCAVIPARSGSKGVPNKNMRLLGGKPLIQWSIEAARNATCIDRVLLSTDNQQIAEEGVKAGAEVPFLRPAQFAGDCSPVIDAVEHLVLSLEETEGSSPDYICLLQPTSPFRTAQDIDDAFGRLNEMKAEAVISVRPAQDHPLLCRTVDKSGQIKPYIEDALNSARRQDLPPAYVLNGAIYLIKTSRLLKERCWTPVGSCEYCMTNERSVDIDDESDLEWAEWLLQRRRFGEGGERV